MVVSLDKMELLCVQIVILLKQLELSLSIGTFLFYFGGMLFLLLFIS